jgi:hypothetical protein
VPPTRNTLSKNFRAQSVELPNKHWAAVMTPVSNDGDGSEMTRATTHGSDQPSTLASACRAASELHDRIEIWVNEGGGGGEPDESTPRARSIG